MANPLLVDAFGRPFTDLRISVTDRCNFSCFYCHNEGQGSRVKPPTASHNEELSVDEIQQVARVAATFGVTHAKLSGGEPLVRPDLEDIVAAVRRHMDVSLVTNGSMLEHRAVSLRHAGLGRVNVSVDSLDAAAFSQIRGGQLAPVLRGIRAAAEAGLRPVKINSVVYARTVENIGPLIDYVGHADGLELQLIQYMPEMAHGRAEDADVADIHARLSAMAERIERRRTHNRRRYLVRGAWVEVVDPVNNPAFCMGCTRLRLTADGHLKGCINRNDDRRRVRGLTDDELATAMRGVVAARVPYYGVHVPLASPASR